MPIDDVVEENCGLCVAHTLHDAYSFIKSLQHRGKEAAGIALVGKKFIDVIKWVGRVDDFDIDELHEIFPEPKYHTFMAHVRYATRGRKDQVLEDAHPHVIGGKIHHNGSHIIITDAKMAIVHNGQVNAEYLAGIDRAQLRTGCDTEALLHFYRENGERGLMRRIPGSYTLAIANTDVKDVIVMRDRTGIKPGVMGIKDRFTCVASEDIAFKKNGARVIEDLEPGHVYYLTPSGGVRNEKVIDATPAHCFFEYNYIANMESILNEVSVRSIRKNLGRALADEFCPPDADCVTFLPRCPEFAARAYATKTGIPFQRVFYKKKDERSFLGSTTEERKKSIRGNLYVVPRIDSMDSTDWMRNKTIILIDDSTIRGNNSQAAIQLLRESGAKKVYLLNYTPKIGVIGEDGEPRGCLYGVDMPPDDAFIVRDGGRNRTDAEISAAIGVETYFLSVPGMIDAFKRAGIMDLCTFCIGGKRPF